MSEKNTNFHIHVTSEVGTLRGLLVHSPDSGLGKVVPSKAQDWLFEDIVHLDNMRRHEYDYYTKILLYFLDCEKVKGKIKDIDTENNKRGFYKPDNENFHKSDKVVELQLLLCQILEDSFVRTKLIAAICAVENCYFDIEKILLEQSSNQLAKTLISGTLPSGEMIFAPVPNMIFTRDIGIVIKNYVLLNKPAKVARTREALLTKYIFHNHSFFSEYRNHVIEIPNSEHHFLLPDGEKDYKAITLEGGDVMMVAENHLLIGVSERTSAYAANQVIKILFEKNILDKVTVVKIPKKRDYMHIDTIFTQVKRNMWVLLGSLAKGGEEIEKKDFIEGLIDEKVTDKLKIMQFEKGKENNPRSFEYLEDLLEDISLNDLKSTAPVKFIYSGNNEFPYGAREQWTDSCNLLALKEGVV
ncbi:MAG: amidinotransferase, partial [Verrucomicrobia bacterium]|nr:amidinotransferase [Cytophagales bacterium]